ncbi:MAG: alpha/beta fold hydrolase [Bacteroidota bacterium]
MKQLLKIATWTITLIASMFFVIYLVFYLNQEKIIFHPQKLSADYTFEYTYGFEEIYINTADNIKLHGLLFKADSSKGLVFYLHGNAGSLSTWGRAAKPFLDNNYDCFILDYRGYGKSEGEISSEDQLLSDVIITYDKISKRYKENNVIVVGYSIGTGPAAYIASEKNPYRLVLKAPYNNLAYMQQLHYSWLPSVGLKYKLTTDEYLVKADLPVTIFHGDDDRLIPYECSLKLQETFDDNDTLIMLYSQGHNGISDNAEYIKHISRILD